MARKKRLQEIKEIPEVKPPEPVSYQDPFQAKVNKQIDQFGKKVEGKGRTILYAVGAFVVAAILIGIIYSWSRRSNNTAQVALSNAIETSIAPVTTQPIPPEYRGKAFKTERERAQAAVDEFQAVAEKYGSPVREKAQYFAAVNRISLDRPAAIQELENLTKNPGEIGALAKFALAQAKQGDNKLDEAAALYQELAAAKDSVVAKDTISFELASIYEKQGKKAEAIELYFNIAKKASEAKDSEGKAIPLSQTAREAKDRLKTLDPAKAAEIKEETPTTPELN
jgi:predicted negative regulator of RcsB-dependent stress response